MKVKKLVLALSAFMAVPFSAYATDAPISVLTKVYMAGATAQTAGLGNALKNICDTATGSTFISLTDRNGLLPTPIASTAKAWVCKTTNTTDTFTGLDGIAGSWAVLKSEGGSSDGFKAVASRAKKAHLDLTQCSYTGNSGTCVRDDSNTQFAYLGLSDVSGKIWAGRGQLAGFTTYPNDSYDELPTGAGQGFGVVVSPSLFALLQTDQGLSGSQVPSISKAQYATLMLGSSNAWDVLLDRNVATKPTEPLLLSRRKSDSGTTASTEAYFLNNPCASKAGILGTLDAAYAVSGTTADVFASAGVGLDMYIVQAGSSDQVLLNAKADYIASPLADTRLTVKAAVGATPAVKTRYVIGVVSLENPENSTWKYVSINDVHPGTYANYHKTNLVNGKYDFQFESTMTVSTRTGVPTSVGIFATALQNQWSTGANLATAYGLYSDPNVGTNDGSISASAFTRKGNECSALTRF